MMLGPYSQLPVTQGAHLTAQGLFAHRNAEFFPQPLDQIAQTPAHNAIKIGCRPAFDGLRQGCSLEIVQKRLRREPCH